jgi:2-keto-4-pentenoate hydratase/2-oxohepta-3-ene-1,7-dioic acid hydratase in catechol pathway
MKLATFSDDKPPRIGVVVGQEIVDLSLASPGLPTQMIGLLSAGQPALAKARAAASSPHRKSLQRVKLHAPVPRPPEFMIVGANYADHAAEGAKIKGTGLDEILKNAGAGQELPLLVNKQTTCVTGPYDNIHMPRISKEHLDYEGELGIVIGKTCKSVSYEGARAVIAGYTVINDVSVRDWQMKTPFPTFGKSFDTHGPMGPWIVTADEIDPHHLNIRTLVNGAVRQSSNTDKLIFDCYKIVELFSKAFTLRVGTVISTGTMAGVGIVMEPPGFLAVGDIVEVEVEGIGSIINKVVEEPEGYVVS